MDDLEELGELEEEIRKKAEIWKRECEVICSFYLSFFAFLPFFPSFISFFLSFF